MLKKQLKHENESGELETPTENPLNDSKDSEQEAETNKADCWQVAQNHWGNHDLSFFPAGKNKKPLVKWKPFQKKRPTEEEIQGWRERFPNANVAMPTGKMNNLTVIDCDTPAATKLVESLIPESVRVPKVRTPRGGCHLYFEFCQGLSSQNGILDGVDIKSEGGYVLAPPSRTAQGRYTWDTDCNLETIAVCPAVPAELLNRLLEAKKARGAASPGKSAPLLSDGRRNDDIFHMCLALARAGDPDTEVEQAALRLAKTCDPPMPEEEAIKTARSALNHAHGHSKDDGASPSLELEQVRFSDVSPEPVEWLMKDRIPMGMVTVFLGDPGEGKTLATIAIASKISKGEPLPGAETALIKGSTIFISAENSLEHVLVPRAIACGADQTKLIHMRCVRSKDSGTQIFNVTKHLPKLKKDVAENPDIKLVVIDPLISHLGNKVDTFKAEQVRQAMDLLSEFAERTGVAVIVVMHMNKSAALKLLYRVSGSVQFMAAAKAAFCIAKETHFSGTKDVLGNFVHVKANVSATKVTLKYRLEACSIDDGRIPTCKFIFEEESTDTPPGCIPVPGKSMRLSKTVQAEEFLGSSLKDGPKAARVLIKEAERLLIDKSTLQKARTKMGYVTRKGLLDGGWEWSKPKD